MIRQELGRIFRQSNLYIALAAFLLCLSGASAQMWIIRSAEGDAALMSAMQLCFTPVFFGGSILLVPFCAAISCSQAQVDEITGGMSGSGFCGAAFCAIRQGNCFPQ